MKKKKGSHSAVKEVTESTREIDLDLETESDEEMKNTENARKLKRIAKEKRKKAIDTAWKSKPLYDQYLLQSQKADVDLYDNHQWLRSVGRITETGGFIVDAQVHSLFTRNFLANILHNRSDPRFRFCNTSTDTINHLISGCTILVPDEYKNGYNCVGQYIIGNSVTIMILKRPTNRMSMNRYLLHMPQM